MKQAKKILGLLLAVVMILSISPLSAFASEIGEGQDPVCEHQYAEGVCALCGEPEPIEDQAAEDAEEPEDELIIEEETEEEIVVDEVIVGDGEVVEVAEPIAEFPALDEEFDVAAGLAVRVIAPEGALPAGVSVLVSSAAPGLYEDALMALSVSFELDGAAVEPLLPFQVYVKSGILVTDATLGVVQFSAAGERKLDLLDASELKGFDLAFLATAAADFVISEGPDRVIYLSEQEIEGDASDGAHVKVSGLLPEGAIVKIEPVVLTPEQEIAVGAQGKTYVAYDISIYSDGELWEPANEQILRVAVTPPSVTVSEKDDVSVTHIDEEDNVTDLGAADVAAGAVFFDAPSFSIYVIIIEQPAGELLFEGEGYSVIISYSEESEIPVGTILTVNEICEGDEGYEELLADTLAAMNPMPEKSDFASETEWSFATLFTGVREPAAIRFLDFTLSYDGVEIEPNPAHPLKIEVRYDEAIEAEIAEGDELSAEAVHFAEQGEAVVPEVITDVQVETNAAGGAVAFVYEQNSFSTTALALFGNNSGNASDQNTITSSLFNKYFFPSQGSHNAANYLIFRYGPYGPNGANVFQLGATVDKNNNAAPDGVFPGDALFPDPTGNGRLADICEMAVGTTLMEILERAYTTTGANGFNWYTLNWGAFGGLPSSTGGIKFIMDATYEIGQSNYDRNVQQFTAAYSYVESVGVNLTSTSSEWWRAFANLPQNNVNCLTNGVLDPNKQGYATGSWQPVTIQRGQNFDGPLVDVHNPLNRNLNVFYDVTIDNCSAHYSGTPVSDGMNDSNRGIVEPIAVQVTTADGLMRMEQGSKITDSTPGSPYVGTGVKLTGFGRVEVFGTNSPYGEAKIEKMAVAVEQISGKTSLKSSASAFSDNTIGIALTHGQSIGKWIDDLNYAQGNARIPIWLRDVSLWHSGDIVMDTGRNNKIVSGTYHEYYTPVVAADANTLNLQNSAQLAAYATTMGLEFYTGTNPSTGGHWVEGTPQPDPNYPVIRFYVGTVLNTRTGTWYPSLWDAVNLQHPVHLPNESVINTIQDGDTLVFYGSTIEPNNIAINYNLDIRASYDNPAEIVDSRAGDDCVCRLNGYTITVNAGKTVTFGGNKTTDNQGTAGTVSGSTVGKLTLDGGGSSVNVIQNNGTLVLKDKCTVANADTYGVHQSGIFHEDGGNFSGNGYADVYLKSTATQVTSPSEDRNDRPAPYGNASGSNCVITLDSRPTDTNHVVTIVLGESSANLYGSRNIVISGSGTVASTDRVGLFELHSATYSQLTPKHLSYVFTQSDDASGRPVLELDQEAFFAIYHSHDNSVVKVYQSDMGSATTYNIKADVPLGYYYGGYYKDYQKKGNYSGDGNAPSSGAVAYAGGAGSWRWADAYKPATYSLTGANGFYGSGSGTAITPVFSKTNPVTYFLKEIPSNFLQPYLHIVYQDFGGHGGLIQKLYLMTGVDDLNFQNVSIRITGPSYEGVTNGFKVYSTVSSSNFQVLTCSSLFNANGFLAVWNYDTILANAPYNAGTMTFSYQAEFRTPDGITVQGTTERLVYIQDGTYLPNYHFAENVQNTGIFVEDGT